MFFPDDSQMEAPPQSLRWLLCRLCSQMEAPPQSLHWPLTRLCSQMEAPLQSLHCPLWRLCSQMEAPPLSWLSLLSRLCSQMEAPRSRVLAPAPLVMMMPFIIITREKVQGLGCEGASICENKREVVLALAASPRWRAHPRLLPRPPPLPGLPPRLILLLQIISARPSKQPLMVLGPLNSLLWYVPSSRYIWSSAPIFCFCKNK
jgi:hypothetical protein